MHRIPPEFNVVIPEERTAQFPAEKRDNSRLLVLDRYKNEIVHIGLFRDIRDFIAGDLIVLNETKVLPARVNGVKPGGGQVEVLFIPEYLTETASGEVVIDALINPYRRLREGLMINMPLGAYLTLQSREAMGWKVLWKQSNGIAFRDWLDRVGNAPLPPYIRRAPVDSDRERYQTVYARQAGSVAAPTAGLHFTDDLLKELVARGSQIANLTLDVGLGTFQPIQGNDLNDHKMHVERFFLPEETAKAISTAKANGRKITSVGTTVVRTLEGRAQDGLPLKPGAGSTGIFIYPPYNFRVVERLLTNFHRPDSTLLQLVAALIGWDNLNLCYENALSDGFNFYSYGDAMLVI